MACSDWSARCSCASTRMMPPLSGLTLPGVLQSSTHEQGMRQCSPALERLAGDVRRMLGGGGRRPKAERDLTALLEPDALSDDVRYVDDPLKAVRTGRAVVPRSGQLEDAAMPMH